MTVILENALIESLAKGLPRSPDQLNALRESDAEVVRLPATGRIKRGAVQPDPRPGAVVSPLHHVGPEADETRVVVVESVGRHGVDYTSENLGNERRDRRVVGEDEHSP